MRIGFREKAVCRFIGVCRVRRSPMLEILLIWSISTKLATKLKAKGRNATGYVLLFIFLWIAGEILGAIVGVVVAIAMDPHAMESSFEWVAYIFALIGAAVGGTIGYVIANSVPPLEDERRLLNFTDEKWDDESDRKDD